MSGEKNALNEQEALKKIADLQSRISHYELAEQRTRRVQHQLDTQVEMFTRIHEYTQQAFHVLNLDALNEIIAEGVVDIFQLEHGAVFSLNPVADMLTLSRGCNMAMPELSVAVPIPWAKRNGILAIEKHKTFFESPVPDDSPWAALGFVHAVFTPIINNDRKCEAIILGGISKQGEAFYDFNPAEILSSFIVYCQQMNGIYNNLLSLEKANEAGKEKTIFLANLSHEMRTPLNAIIGSLQIYVRTRGKREIEKEIRQIEISSKHLVNLINSILDISKIEEGMFVLDKEQFDLKTVMDNVYESLLHLAEKKMQTLTLDYNSLKSFNFIGDSTRLFQVLVNLVSNAIKFTSEYGKIEIFIKEMSRDSDKVLMEFSVIDNGIGIPPEFLANIFSPFSQAKSSIATKYGGTGLGLTISQRIVELMGGKIYIESELNKGACFYFSVWFELDKNAMVNGDTEPLHEIPDFSGKRLLVVDDVEINREIVCFMLAQTGVITEQAENGQDAVGMVEASEEGYYDLILMDIQMPVMDGYTATKQIKAMPRADVKDMSIVAITANAFREDVEQALETGMAGHIRKPIEESNLFETLYTLFNRKDKIKKLEITSS